MAERRLESPIWDRWRQSSLLRFGSGLGAVAGIAFILSPFDAQFRGFLATEVFVNTLSPLAVGATVFGISATIDGISAAFVWLGMRLNKPLLDKLRVFLDKLEPPKKTEEPNPELAEQSEPSIENERSNSLAAKAKNRLRDLSASLSVGAGFTLIFSPPEQQKDDRAWRMLRKQALGFTVFNGAFFGSIAWLAAWGGVTALSAGSREVVDFVVKWLPDWRPWTVLTIATLTQPWLSYGIGKAFSRADAKVTRRKTKGAKPPTRVELVDGIYKRVPIPEAELTQAQEAEVEQSSPKPSKPAYERRTPSPSKLEQTDLEAKPDQQHPPAQSDAKKWSRLKRYPKP